VISISKVWEPEEQLPPDWVGRAYGIYPHLNPLPQGEEDAIAPGEGTSGICIVVSFRGSRDYRRNLDAAS